MLLFGAAHALPGPARNQNLSDRTCHELQTSRAPDSFSQKSGARHGQNSIITGLNLAASGSLLLPLSLATALQAQTPPPPPIMLGTAWYPEQWPESRWDADLTLMQQAGIHMVRVGEFAWSRMEPSEGHYDLDWLDRAVAAAAKHGIYTVVGTPTAAPPAWLTQKYPETLRIDEAGPPRSNMETGSSSTSPIPSIANWHARSPSRWPSVSDTILTCWAGKSITSIPGHLVRSRYQDAIPAVAQGAIWHSGQSERALDHLLLERNHF